MQHKDISEAPFFFTCFKIVQLSPFSDAGMRRNDEKHKEKIRPLASFQGVSYFISGRPNSISGHTKLHFWGSLTSFWGRPFLCIFFRFSRLRGLYFLPTFLPISPHPLVCDSGALCHLNKSNKLLLTRETCFTREQSL